MARELLYAQEVSSALDIRVAKGEELAAVIQGADGLLAGSDDLASLARSCAVRTSTEGERSSFISLFLAKGMWMGRDRFLELPGYFFHEVWGLAKGQSLGFFGIPHPFGPPGHQIAQAVLAGALHVAVNELRIEFPSVTRKGSQCRRALIPEVPGLSNAAARDFSNLQRQFLPRGHAQITPHRCQQASNAAFEALEHAGAARRSQGGLVLVSTTDYLSRRYAYG